MSDKIKSRYIPSQRRLGLLLLRYRKPLTAIAIFGLFQGLLSLLPPLGIQAILSYLLTGTLSVSIIVLITLILMGISIAGWITIIQLSILESITQKVYVKGALEFWMRLPFLKDRKPGGYSLSQWTLRFFEIPIIQKSLIKLILDVSTATFQLCLGIVLLGIYHPLLIIPGLLLTVFLYLIVRITGKRGLQHAIDSSTLKYRWMHWLLGQSKRSKQDIQSTLSSSNAEADVLLQDYLHHRNKQFTTMRIQWYSMLFLKVLATGLVLSFGVWLVLTGSITLGAFVASELVIVLILNSMEKIWLSLDAIYDLLVGFEKVGNYTDQEIEEGHARNIKK